MLLGHQKVSLGHRNVLGTSKSVLGTSKNVLGTSCPWDIDDRVLGTSMSDVFQKNVRFFFKKMKITKPEKVSLGHSPCALPIAFSSRVEEK